MGTILPDKLKVEEEEDANVSDLKELNDEQKYIPTAKEYSNSYPAARRIIAHGEFQIAFNQGAQIEQDFEPSREEYGKFYFGNHREKKKLAGRGKYTEQDHENNLSEISKET